MEVWCAEDPTVVATVERVRASMDSIRKHMTEDGRLQDVEDIQRFRERIREFSEPGKLLKAGVR